MGPLSVLSTGATASTSLPARLWALSLAHSQLTDVFFEKVLGLCLGLVKEKSMKPEVGGVVMFFGFAIWLAVTFGVLMVMESLSAVLHALRLHWVEFQNKYYKGDGAQPSLPVCARAAVCVVSLLGVTPRCHAQVSSSRHSALPKKKTQTKGPLCCLCSGCRNKISSTGSAGYF